MNQNSAPAGNPGTLNADLHAKAVQLMATGELQQAAEISQQLMRENPDDYMAIHLAAYVALEQKRLLDANDLFKLSVQRAPDARSLATDWYGLGCTLREAGDFRQAEEAFRRAATLDSAVPSYWMEYGRMLAAQSKFEEATEALRKSIQRAPGAPAAYGLLGNVLTHLNRHADALVMYEQSLSRDPDSPYTHFNLGTVYQVLGRIDDARNSYLKALELDPAMDGYAQLGEVKTYTSADDPIIRVMQDHWDNPNTPLNLKLDTGFALAKAYDDLGEYDRAFAVLESANRLKRSTVDFSMTQMEQNTASIIETFSKSRIESLADTSANAAAPIFIVGMPRSGSTLVEQILSAHSNVKAGGELPVLPMLHRELATRWNTRGPNAPGTTEELREDVAWLASRYVELTAPMAANGGRLTDKAPNNYRSIGLIHLAFPNAKIIHTRRNPLDTCLSCYQRLFSSEVPYNYDLRELGQAHLLHDKLMAHWHEVLPDRVLEVDYEALVENPDAQIHRILEFCQLPFEPGCLEFHKVKRAVTTASSAQVRQPLYKSSLEKWRHYEKHLAPLREILGV